MKRNAIIFSNVDREDYWVTSGLVFKVENTDTYQDAYNEVKEQLESDEIVNHIIKENCLESDLFDGDETFKFVKTYWDYALCFVFEDEYGNQVEHKMSADFCLVAN